MRPRPASLLLAVGLDLALGEPPDRWHPVAWIGRVLARVEARVPRRTVAAGGAAVLGVTAVVTAAAALAGWMARRLGPAPAILVEAALLAPAFAIRRLTGAAAEVERALQKGRLDEARALTGRHLVSRDTGALTGPQVTSAAIESVAENLTDSVLAPLLAYAAGGLPAAWGYRALNTADAMWGYRDARYERFGKVAARLDDAANLLPAPLAAMAVSAGAGAVGEDGAAALRTAWREHGRTASPNAGWPMAAMAGALRVGLAKPGHYRLGPGDLPADPATIGRATRVFAGAATVTVAVALVLAAWRAGATERQGDPSCSSAEEAR